MKIEISDYYKDKGYDTAYLFVNKEPRRSVVLHGNGDKKALTMSYAKYLYTSHHKCDILEGYEIDHINNDKLDDRIENLQILSKKENIRKSHPTKKMVEIICPVCGKTFMFEAHNLSTHPNPCCSRRCGSIKSHWSLKENLQKETK